MVAPPPKNAPDNAPWLRLYGMDFPRRWIAATVAILNQRNAFTGVKPVTFDEVAPVIYAALQALYDHGCRVYFGPVVCVECWRAVNTRARQCRDWLERQWQPCGEADKARRQAEAREYRHRLEEQG